MPSDDAIPPTGSHLAERSLDGVLPDGENASHVLTNRRVGVSRAAGDEVLRVEPGGDWGAVAAVSDTHVHFLVGDPDGYDGDYAASVPLAEVVDVERRTESLARALLVETADGATWEFTVREGPFDDAVASLARQLGRRLVREARTYRREAASTDDREERIELLEDALTAFQRVGGLPVTVEQGFDEGETAREVAESVIADLVEARLAFARTRRSRGNWDAQAGEESAVARHFADARAGYERALELADSFPAGDADEIAAKLDSLDERVAELSLASGSVSRDDD